MKDPIGVREFLDSLHNADNDEVNKAVQVTGTIAEITLVLTPTAIQWARANQIASNRDGINFQRRAKHLRGLEYTMPAQEWTKLCQELGISKEVFELA
ncbi:MAG TPA: hypothetical protein VKP88_03975 [Candidatus Paceibacterota bacterium]|nr:hypothetical protein [Candidatus Paceibacterota bacterium]